MICSRYWVIRATIMIIVLTLAYPLMSEATLFKWKDDKGKTHFTDDPGKIPSQYRKKSKLTIRKGFDSPAPAPEKQEPLKQVDEPEKENEDLANEQSSEKSLEELIAELEDKKKKLEEELVAIVSAVEFFDKDVPRYDDFYDQFPGRIAYRKLKVLMAETVKGKKEVAEKLKPFDSDVATSVLAYINSSLVGDEWLHNRRAPTKAQTMSQVKTTVARLKKELSTKKSLHGKLQKEQVDLGEELKALTAELEEIRAKTQLAKSK